MFYIKMIFLLLAVEIWMHAANDERCEIDKEFTVIHESSQIGGVVYSFIANTIANCVIMCVQHIRCKSFNFNDLTRECQLSSLYSKMTTLTKRVNWVHMETDPHKKFQGRHCIENSNQCERHDYCRSLCGPPWYECMCINEKYGKSCDLNPCKNNGRCINSCSSPGYKCVCSSMYGGEKCEDLYAINFVSKSQEHSITEINFPSLTAVSVCFWFRDEGVDDQWRAMVGLIQITDKCNFFLLILDSGSLLLTISARSLNFTQTVEKNKWYHICVIYDSSVPAVLLYLNGESVKTFTLSSLEPFNVDGIILGQDTDQQSGVCVVNDINQGLIGYLTLLNVWSRRLTYTEIYDVYLGNVNFADLLTLENLLKFKETDNIKKVLISSNLTIH